MHAHTTDVVEVLVVGALMTGTISVAFADGPNGKPVIVAAYEVNGADATVRNSFERPNAVTVQTRQVAASGNRVEYTFPAHSVTLLRCHVS